MGECDCDRDFRWTMAPVINFFTNNRGGKILKTEDNHLFSKTNSVQTTEYYECLKRKSESCPVSLVLRDGNISSLNGEHNHTAEFRDVVELKETEFIAANLKENNRKIISEIYALLKKEGLEAFMSSSKSLRQKANRARAKDRPVFSKTSFEIPEKYRMLDDKPFLRYDSEISGERVMIFASNSGLKLLEESQEHHGDGHFETSPKEFYQIYTIFAKVQSSQHLVPCVFAFLPNKSAEVYEVLLHQVLKLLKGARPQRFMIDFEPGMLKALDNVYVGVE